MWGEFRAFLLKSNALALAFGVVIGIALGNVVNSLVQDIIMPPIGVLLGGIDFTNLVIKLKDATADKPEVDIRYGAFINLIIVFVVVAFIVFWLSKAMIKPAPETPSPAMKQCPYCRESVFAEATRCSHCGSAI